MRISVIVLSFNGRDDTVACLSSLLEASDGLDVIVVDNASEDGSQAAIRSAHPDVTLIELADNLGWAGGNNVGVRRALDSGADLVCLLNNDTLVTPAALQALADLSRRYGPCLMHPSIDYADPADGVQLDPTQSDRAFVCINDTDCLFELDFAYGACLMVPTELFRRLGLFDERFFLQLEETDFWLRAKRAGVRSLCSASVRIVHAESRSFQSRTTPLKTYYIVRNTFLLAEKHYRNVAQLRRAMKQLYWTVWHLAPRRDAAFGPAGWLFSADPHLVAARAGLRDYLTRRFGRISPVARRAIEA